MIRPVAIVVVAVALHTAIHARADDLGYLSKSELEAEITRRQEDIARTDYRISAISSAEAKATAELAKAREAGAIIERQAITRARALYRISRNGGSLRYLLGARSPVELLRRLSELKRLLIEGLEERRQAGHRIASAERRVASLEEEKTAAFQMKDMLVDTLLELEAARNRQN